MVFVAFAASAEGAWSSARLFKTYEEKAHVQNKRCRCACVLPVPRCAICHEGVRLRYRFYLFFRFRLKAVMERRKPEQQMRWRTCFRVECHEKLRRDASLSTRRFSLLSASAVDAACPRSAFVFRSNHVCYATMPGADIMPSLPSSTVHSPAGKRPF